MENESRMQFTRVLAKNKVSIILQGIETGEHQRAEIDYNNMEVSIINKIINTPGGDLRFRPIYPEFKETTVLKLSFRDWKRIFEIFNL
jgi:hypothetical protein